MLHCKQNNCFKKCKFTTLNYDCKNSAKVVKITTWNYDSNIQSINIEHVYCNLKIPVLKVFFRNNFEKEQDNDGQAAVAGTIEHHIWQWKWPEIRAKIRS